MIPYEELVAALEGYVARGRAPLAQSERAAPIAIGTASSGRAPAAPAFVPPSPSRPQAPPPVMHSEEVDLGHYDEAHDPDQLPLGGQHEEDSTHVGAMPLTSPPRHHEEHGEHGDEIDIGDVLTDDEV
ncbi:MAG TPA: hypothetical protein VIA18_15735 [Polyangia bacterium]|jgi:hypothetical protein|nr:hypothetical protein [Polyangia bacterium]